MTIQDLLSRAAELAPEWCRVLGDYYHFSKLYPGACIRPDGSVNEGSRAIILFAVLKECERRGISIEVNNFYRGIRSTADLWSAKVWGQHITLTHTEPDPATAVLATFVEVLEQCKEAPTPASPSP